MWYKGFDNYTNRKVKEISMIKAIIIDDEKKCVSYLQKLLQEHAELEVVAATNNPEEGIKFIEQHEPDLVFLDIEMPNKNGFEVLEAVKDFNLSVVFTTAYQQYAINAIRYAALDYLLKPIDKTELANAIKQYKVKQKKAIQQEQFDLLFSNIKNSLQPPSRISIATIEGLVFINTADIIYCEALSSYANIFMKNNEKLLSSKTLKDLEEILQNNSFFRIHHSYLINTNEIKRYVKGDGGTIIMSNKTELPVSKRKKEDFLKHLNR